MARSGRDASALMLMVAVVALQASSALAVVRICLPVAPNQAVQEACTALLNRQAANRGVDFACVLGGSGAACIEQVAQGSAELTKFGGDSLYTATFERGLSSYVAETIALPSDQAPGSADDAYYSVAVTTSATCQSLGNSPSLASFKGKRACHTGYRRTAGWVMPVGLMVDRNIMPVADKLTGVQQDAESVAEFFSQVCAPGTTSAGPGQNGASYTPLCSACKGDCSDNKSRETYVDYEGALKCLSEGSGDIAFTKHTTVFDYTVGGSSAQSWSRARSDLRLVCPNGGCRPITDWASCNIAGSATHTFVGQRAFAGTTEGAAALQILAALNTSFITATRSLDSGNPQLLFTSGAAGTRLLPDPTNPTAHFGENAAAYFRSTRNLQVSAARICTISAAEQQFCERAVAIMNARPLGVRFGCVQRDSDDSCLQAIRSNEADVRAVDGPDVYNGFKDYALKAIVAEEYGTGDGIPGTEYFAIAMVTKQWCDSTAGGSPTFADLKGKRSCNTGYRRNAGWSMPVGFLIQNKFMQVVRNDPQIEDDAESMAAFFSGGLCAARAIDNGPQNTADKKGARWAPLCSRCAGDCSSNPAQEPFYDYAGAARCLHENSGDVAWTKHSVALDTTTDGKTPASWSKLGFNDLRLLCPSGGCRPLSQASSCYVARAVAHAVMARADFADTERVKAALNTISQDAEFKALVFNGTNNPNNHVFKSVTVRLVPINDDTRSYLAGTLATFQGLDALNAGGNLGGINQAASPGSSSDDGGDKLSAGAVAGIAVGCAVAGVLIAVAGIVLWNRRRQTSLTQALSGSLPSDASAQVTTKGSPSAF